MPWIERVTSASNIAFLGISCYALKSSPASFQRSVVQRTFCLGEFRSIVANLLDAAPRTCGAKPMCGGGGGFGGMCNFQPFPETKQSASQKKRVCCI